MNPLIGITLIFIKRKLKGLLQMKEPESALEGLP